MAFDLSTAQPVEQAKGFDLSTAKPVDTGGMPTPRRSWGDVAYEATFSLPSSAGKFIGGMYEAVTSPVETGKNVLDVARGAVQNVLPARVKAFLDEFDTNPEATKRTIELANAVGGVYKDRFGSVDGFKNALATDPVGVAADIATLLSGGAGATAKIPQLSSVLSKASAIINPLTLPAKAAEFGVVKAAQGIGGAVDLMRGQRPTMKAANMLRAAVTEEGRTPQNLLAAQTALQNAPANVTARQALADITMPQVQYLGRTIEARTPGRTATIEQGQEAARQASLGAVTPDLAAAEAARTASTKPLYAQAEQAVVQMDPAMEQLFNRMPRGTLEKAADIARMENRPFVMGQTTPAQQVPSAILGPTGQPVMQTIPAQTAEITGESLHYIKRALSDIANAPAAVTGAGRDTQAAARGVLADFTKKFEQEVPVYGTARTEFAQRSAPVNQSQVLQAMSGKLEDTLTGGERARPFMNALGQGEQALLKKATGYPRYTELSDVLTPQQMNVVSNVGSELRRDAVIAEQAQKGASAMQDIIEANRSKFRIPSFLNAKATLTNEMLKLMQGKLSADVLIQLEKGFESATNLNDLLSKVPTAQRVEVLRALGQAQGKLTPNKLAALSQASNVNALVPRITIGGIGRDESGGSNALAPAR